VSALTAARRSTSRKLSGLDIPEAFTSATVSACARAIDRKADRKTVRRLADKVARIQAPTYITDECQEPFTFAEFAAVNEPETVEEYGDAMRVLAVGETVGTFGGGGAAGWIRRVS
jgi:hypothetical protein